MTKQEIIVDLLKRNGEMYGLELVEKSGGALKRGTVYVTLKRMEDANFIQSRLEARAKPEIGIARRLYSLPHQKHLAVPLDEPQIDYSSDWGA